MAEWPSATSLPSVPSGARSILRLCLRVSQRNRSGVRFRGTANAAAEASCRGASVRVIADASVALVDHARAERPGLDQLQRDVFGDRWKERRAATDNVGVAEHA